MLQLVHSFAGGPVGTAKRCFSLSSLAQLDQSAPRRDASACRVLRSWTSRRREEMLQLVQSCAAGPARGHFFGFVSSGMASEAREIVTIRGTRLKSLLAECPPTKDRTGGSREQM